MFEVIQQVANFEVIANGNRLIGSLSSVDLPELNYMSTEVKGAGIAGQIDVTTIAHMEAMECTLHWRSIYEQPTYLLGQDAVQLSLRGAVQKQDSSTYNKRILPVRVDLTALAAGATLGKLEPGEHMETESKFNVGTISIKIDGRELFVHDFLNFRHVVNGVDYASQIRAALL